VNTGNCDFVFTDVTPGLESFTDGLWHSVSIDVLATQGSANGRVTVTVDGRPDISSRRLDFTASSEFFIGGMFMLVFKNAGREGEKGGTNFPILKYL